MNKLPMCKNQNPKKILNYLKFNQTEKAGIKKEIIKTKT